VRPIVLLHGFTGSPQSWADVIARLPGRVDAEPILGHDQGLAAARPGGFLGEVDRLAERIRVRADGPVHLVGYSLGARLALGLLCRHPAGVASATLVGGSPGLSDEPARVARRADDACWVALLVAGDLARFADAWVAKSGCASQARLPAAALDRARAIRRGHDPAGLALALRELGLAEMPDLRGELPRVQAPVRFVAGAADDRFARLAAEQARATPRARVALVSGAGHDVPLERPAELAALIATDRMEERNDHV
jgi:2-succinyl-6-hydroxy-2,4-cyclohexadiene-1-carboxylate synthase